MNDRIIEIASLVKERLESVHIGCFRGMEKPLFLISTTYPGVWLEHVYDSVFYAMQDKSKLYLAENAVELFLSHQKEDGQLPCFVRDAARTPEGEPTVGYGQIQECVSFARLCLLVYKMNGRRDFLEGVYAACSAWVGWLQHNRMTRRTGLVEMFVGYDTGHDNSGRLAGLSCIGNYRVNGEVQNAAVLPPSDEVAPVIAVDMNCNYFATLTALSEMASLLGESDRAAAWQREAARVKERLFALCFDPADCFFYDVDKHGKQRKFLSSTLFHLFMEGVLDPEADAPLIGALYGRHIANPLEFDTPYPYPSMAISDPCCRGHAEANCWGYYTEGLIALRTTLWMEKYGFARDHERLCRAWVEAWTRHFDKVKMGQELDPLTGEPTACSEWYSSTMLFYLYATKKYDFEKEEET